MVYEHPDRRSFAADQLDLFQTVFDYFDRRVEWPNCRDLQLQLEGRGDPWKIATGVSADFLLMGDKHNTSATASLTIEGISLCAGSDLHLNLFLEGLQGCIAFYRANAKNPTFTHDDVVTQFHIHYQKLERVQKLFECERHLWAGYSSVPRKEFSFTISPDVLQYSQVQSIADYVVIRRRQRAQVARVPDATPLSSAAETSASEELAFDVIDPAIVSASRGLFEDRHYSQAVFEGSKALVQLVKELSGVADRDGADLMRFVFARKDPILAFSGLKSQTDADVQEGMMHLHEGVVLALKNRGSHSIAEIAREQAISEIRLLSYLASRAKRAKKRRRRRSKTTA